MKFQSLIIVCLIVASFPVAAELNLPGPFLYGEKVTKEIDEWNIIDRDNISLAYTYEKDKPSQNPRLNIDCVSPLGAEKRYRLYLDTEIELQLLEPEWADVIVIVDEDNRPPMKWYAYDNNKLLSSREKINLENMLDGNVLNIRFRDKLGLNEYTYALKGLSDVLEHVTNVCGFNYKFKDNSKDEIKPKLEKFATEMNSNLPRLLAGDKEIILAELQVKNNTVNHIFVLRDKLNEDISFKEMDEIIQTSKDIGNEFCMSIRDKSNKHHKLFSENIFSNMFVFVDKAGQVVYLDGVSCSR